MSAMFDPYHKWLGIPRSDQPPTHYRLLGINLFESDPDAIANAADQRMTHVKQHQAGPHSAESQAILNRIAAARLCLLHPGRKADYDRHLRESNVPVVAPPIAAAPPVWNERVRPSAGRNLAGPSFWEDDRFWQAVSAATVLLLLGVVALLLVRAKDTLFARVERSAPTTIERPVLCAAEFEVRAAASSLVKPVAIPSPTPAFSSSVSAMLPDGEAEYDGGLNRDARVEVLQSDVKQDAATHRAGGESRPQSIVLLSLRDTASVASRKPPTVFSAAAQTRAKPVYLDDLDEMIASVGWGELGKHGATGYPADHDDYGRRAWVRGTTPRHLLSTHPPDQGTAYVSYALAEDFRTFRALVGILEVDTSRMGDSGHNPLYLGEAFSALTFRVVGNGRVLWQSRPIRRSGEWQECQVSLQGARLLELQVECPGPKTFAWAAWLDPRLEP